MIECIFTIDYEIYGNGTGSLRELAYEPTEKLVAIFRELKKHLVIFVEVSELELIEANGTDPDIHLIKQQIRDAYENGFEIGLHLHPWWLNAQYENGHWLLDYSEYNLCALTRERIIQIIDRSIAYLRDVLGVADFTPLSHRAGHLLFQPGQPLANVLVERGIKIDSSVYKGGLWNQHNLDYRPALRNGYYWKFMNSVNAPHPHGVLLELPIHTRMIPLWRMLTHKRIGLQRKASSSVQTGKKILSRARDYLRFSHPLKFDFCSMTIKELKQTIDGVIHEDEQDPTSFRPIVAIGHTKDLVDYETVELLLAYLEQKGIQVSSFADVYRRVGSAFDESR